MKKNFKGRYDGLFILVPEGMKTANIAEALGYSFTTPEEKHSALVRTLRTLEYPESFPLWRIKEFANLVNVEVAQVLFLILREIIKKHRKDWETYFLGFDKIFVSFSTPPSVTKKMEEIALLEKQLASSQEELQLILKKLKGEV